ncbi:class I SAM-dependent DNA methyltransferase [Thioclava sp. FR2]|uniref:class I SAM-dependent DNA methyltransferase n=1 Tax=Thioclava sp. FR2 TaxID=3445780 RepID=UPI003EB879C5
MSDLDEAYALKGPEDCARLYADWAASYDSEFAVNNDYLLPAHVAAAFRTHGGSGPVLDVGAGTGLLAQNLRALGNADPVDALDLSPQMLERASQKGIYDHLIAADITQPLSLPRLYAGIVSSGTFTHGHVGPDALSNLEQHAAPHALFAVSINAGVFRSMGFDDALDRRGNVTLLEVPIYGPATRDPAHADDRALIALWRHPG